MKSSGPATRSPRRAFTLLEVQVAFVLLGIGLAGVCPLVVMQLRLSRKVARGLDSQSSYFGAGRTFVLSPCPDLWARKLGVAASIVDTDASTAAGTSMSLSPPYVVSIVGPPERSDGGESATLHVSVQKSSSGTGSP